MESVSLKTSLPINLSKPLGAYIQTTYKQDPSNYQQQLRQLDDLRNECISVAACSSTPNTLARLGHYLGQLERLPSRFPIGEQGIKVTFSWFNHGGKDKKPLASFELAYEQANIIFNIGAVYSQLAVDEGTTNVDSLKKACNSFILAAGAFEAAGKRAAITYLPEGTDLGESSLSVLVHLMLAQAQECFVLKAILEKTVKDSILAKLCASTASLFETALRGAVQQNKSVSGLFRLLADHLEAKHIYYRSMGHYRKSCEFLFASNYGKEIVKLQEADEMLKSIPKDLIKRLSPSLASQISSLGLTVSKNLERARKDNSLIYNDPIPSRGSWGELGSAVVVKPAIFPDPALGVSQVDFLFSNLPEIYLNQIATELFSRRSDLVAAKIGRLEEALGPLRSRMEGSGFEGLIESQTSSERLPETLLTHSYEIQALGGYSALEKNRESAQELRSSCKSTLATTFRILDDEEAADNQARKKYGPRWTRPLSSQLNVLLRQRCNELKKMLEKAETSDASGNDLYEKHIAFIVMFCYTKEELERAIPPTSGLTLSTEFLEELRFAVDHFKELQTRYDSVREIINTSAESIDIFSRVQQIGPTSEASTTILQEINEAIGICDEPIQALAIDSADHLRLVERLGSEINSLKGVHSSQGGSSRDSVLQSLFEAYNAYKSITLQFSAANEFYSRTQDHITRLYQVCADFAHSRAQEHQHMSQ